jgi:hypothetical protein
MRKEEVEEAIAAFQNNRLITYNDGLYGSIAVRKILSQC